MRFVVVLIALVCHARAELLATLQTTRGNVVVALQYNKAPQTVANFITLAQGTRTRLHPVSGAVVKGPLYVGETFYRVENGAAFKIAQTGSGTGTQAGGPGYVIRDEFDPTLTHVPYVLSMANTSSSTGPHSNGSQIFFTGNVSIPGLNNVHTVFGLVTDAASRAVIDAIMDAGGGATTITGIDFLRTDAGAQFFDEHSQRLPVCSPVPGQLRVTPGSDVTYAMASRQPAGSVFQVFLSPDLGSWSRVGGAYQGTGFTGDPEVTFGDGTLPKAFYQLSLTTYQDALAPASLADKDLTIDVLTADEIKFMFDSTGQGGSATYSFEPGVPDTITGVVISSLSPYKATWIISTANHAPLRIVANLNSESATEISGYQRTDVLNSIFWSTVSSGAMTLTK